MSHVLIYGSDHLTYRITEQLCAEGCVVSVIGDPAVGEDCLIRPNYGRGLDLG